MQRSPGGVHRGTQGGCGGQWVFGGGDGIRDGHAVGPGPEAVGDIGGGFDAPEGNYGNLHGVFDLSQQGQTLAGRSVVQSRANLHVIGSATLGPRRAGHRPGKRSDKAAIGGTQKIAGGIRLIFPLGQKNAVGFALFGQLQITRHDKPGASRCQLPQAQGHGEQPEVIAVSPQAGREAAQCRRRPRQRLPPAKAGRPFCRRGAGTGRVRSPASGSAASEFEVGIG